MCILCFYLSSTLIPALFYLFDFIYISNLQFCFFTDRAQYCFYFLNYLNKYVDWSLLQNLSFEHLLVIVLLLFPCSVPLHSNQKINLDKRCWIKVNWISWLIDNHHFSSYYGSVSHDMTNISYWWSWTSSEKEIHWRGHRTIYQGFTKVFQLKTFEYFWKANSRLSL